MMKIGKKNIGPGERPYIIAEIGTNHNRSIQTARKLIDMSADCGADAIKFQIYEASDIVNPRITCKEYGFDRWYKEKFALEVFEKHLKTPKEWISQLAAYSRKKKLGLIAAVHSVTDAGFVLSQKFDALKIASMEITNTVLLEEIAGMTKKPVILSSGMSLFPEIEKATAIFQKRKNPVALLHCVSVYPPKYSEMHLSNIRVFANTFNMPIGFSDHSPSNEGVFAAIALGARIIEKHITLDRETKGPDHAFALEKAELKDLVQGSKNIFDALGADSFTKPAKRELGNRDLARKSIVAKSDLKKGTQISRQNLSFARPGTGIQPWEINKVIGKTLKKDLKSGCLISWGHLL